jgi:cytochrome c553
MARTVLLSLGLCLALAAAPRAFGASEEASPRAKQLEFFERSVRPVLAENCFGCHGPAKHKAGLRLDSLAAILKGGDSGPAVKPGEPEESLLIQAVRYSDEDRQMPPKGKLNDAEIAALADWVKAGALWPEVDRAPRPVPVQTTSKVTAEDRAFWSFQPIKPVAQPAVADASWPRSPIDRFVLANLEEAKLKPVAPADRRTLIRRATFDLIGLPPTPEEVEAFLADESPEAFARVVERLLASPRYGERWGRHWLDVARYGEDQAHTFQARMYPNGYRYRDWVIKAFNDDMPYDRFVMEQIAADLLDGPEREQRLAALGFFALGPVYYGKAVFDEFDDRVDTLCRGFLGLTVACARCHDHKFDPIPTEDYYALAGVFASSEYKEYPQAAPDVVAKFEGAQAAIKAKTDEVAAFLAAESVTLAEAATAETASYMVAAWTLHNKRKADPKASLPALARAEELQEPVLARWFKYLFGESGDPKPGLPGWRRVIAAQDPSADVSADPAAQAEVKRAAQAFQEYVRSILALRSAIEAHEKAALGSGVETPKAARPGLDPAELKLLRELVGADGLFAVPKADVEKRLADSSKAQLKAMRTELDRLKRESPPKYPVIHSLAEGSSISNMRVHIRGNPATLGGEVSRRFLSVLSSETPAPFGPGSGRLELARAIASKDNPLTARVIVNRVWERHFGRGLVATPSNFGSLGERPTHPELLDYLAGQFIACGWSLKTLHRAIMLSATYQLSSAFDPHNFEVDPDNTRLWHMNRRRLEVEPWRDAMLAVSGQLDRTLGGPSLDLSSATNHRRTVYAAISRHNLHGLLRLFDFPDPNITSDKRTVTSVPLQQLFVLNSEFVVEQAKSLAARLTSTSGEADSDRVKRAILTLYGRPAAPEEVEWALGFLAGSSEHPASEYAGSGQGSGPLTRWEQYAQILLGSNEFLFID